MDLLGKEKDYLDFLDKTTPYIKDLTTSLKLYFGIANFGHIRFYNDNRYFYLTNDINLGHEHIKSVKDQALFCKQLLHVPNSEYKFMLWPNEPTSKIMEVYRRYNYWNGVTLIKLGDKHTDLWWFASDIENKNISEFFIRNTTLLYKYMLFFEEKIRHLIPIQSSLNLPLHPNGIDVSILRNQNSIDEERKITQFLEEIRLDGITIPAQSGSSFISSREVECLVLMMQGLSAKLIGSKLAISPRTVETHFRNIKNKVGVYSKTGLAEIYNEHVKKHLWHT